MRIKKVKKKKLILPIFLILIFGAALLSFFLLYQSGVKEIKAGSSDNVFGWAWSENIGWISFNNTTGGGAVNYGVRIYQSGVFSGYAWSRGTEVDGGGVGWISFADFDGDGDVDADDKNIFGSPCAPNCEAKLNLVTGEVSGWARALAPIGEPQAGGWDGWIKLRGVTQGGNPYGVRLNLGTREFEGWAWGGDDASSTAVIGWISFNCNNPETGDVCATSSYRVETTFSLPPSAISLSKAEVDYCGPWSMIFSWEFYDPDIGDSQSAYQVQIDDESTFSPPLVKDSGKVSSGCIIGERDEYAPPVGTLDYATTYYWRLKVWDNYDVTSTDWIYPPSPPGSPTFQPGESFGTPLHAYPEPNFTWFPSLPSQEEIAQFCSVQEGVCAGADPAQLSKCYQAGGAEISCSVNGTFLWTFPEGTTFATGTSETSSNPGAKFPAPGPQTVSLRITDDVGACVNTEVVGVALPLPEEWREVVP